MKRAWWLSAALVSVALFGGEFAHASWFGVDKDEAKARLRGRSLNELISVLGYPDSSAQVGDRTVYVWNTYELSTRDEPVYDDPLLKGRRTGTVTTSKQLRCTFKAIFLVDGRFASWSIDGNDGACRKFYRSFLKLPEGPPATAAPASPSAVPPAANPRPGSGVVRPGETRNSLIMFDDYEVSAPNHWRQTDVDDGDGIVSAQFEGASSCLVIGVPLSQGTADDVWNNSLENFAEEGKITAQDAFVENGVPVRVALGQKQGRAPTLFKLSAYARATFIVATNGGLDSPTELKRNDQAFYFCTIRALPGRR